MFNAAAVCGRMLEQKIVYDIKKFQQYLSHNDIKVNNNIHINISSLTQYFDNALNFSKVKRITKNDNYWWTPELSNMRSLLRKYHKVHDIRYKTLLGMYKKLINKAKQTAWSNLCTSNPFGKQYKILKNKKQPINSIAYLQCNNTILTASEDKCKYLISKLFYRNENFLEFKNLIITNNNTNIHCVYPDEVITILKTFNINKSPGIDKIDIKMIKMFNNRFPNFISTILNQCLINNIFPDNWKVGKLVLIQKLDKPADNVNSYRPITLLPVLAKVYEKVIFNILYNLVRDKISPFQFGSIGPQVF